MPIEPFTDSPRVIINRGPVIQIVIGLPVTAPQPQESTTISTEVHQTNGLLDTGASGCCINPSLANRLNLPTAGYTDSVDASNNITRCRIRNASLGFLLSGRTINIIPAIGLTELPQDLPNHNVIIGRNLMATFKVIYFSFSTGEYMIHF